MPKKNERGKQKREYEQLEKVPEETLRRFFDLLKVGNYLETAAMVCGLKRWSIVFWMRKGREDAKKGRDNRWTRFYTDVRSAQAESEARDMALIAKAGQDNPAHWTALAWRLERRFPDKYGRRARRDPTAEEEREAKVPRQELTLFKNVKVVFGLFLLFGVFG